MHGDRYKSPFDQHANEVGGRNLKTRGDPVYEIHKKQE